MKSLFIFRRDYRIRDNIGLYNCIKESDKIYPIFIFTKEQITDKNKYKSDNAIQFMIESLKDLNEQLDSKLNIFFGDDIKILKNISKKLGVTAIFTNTDYTPFAIKRDENIKKMCEKENIIFKTFNDILLYEPLSIRTGTDKIYQKFTPFYNSALKIDVPKPLNIKTDNKFKKINKMMNLTSFDKIKKYYKTNKMVNRKGGRTEGLKILKNIENFKTYEKTRNNLTQKTTELSGYLKFGCISIREVYHILKDKFGKTNPLIRQLIWREFYYNLGFGFSDRFGKSLKPQYDNIKWIGKQSDFEKWKNGKTGFPIVDAAMTQLNKTGYMHNRGRLIVASFLIKNLQINWQQGEKYFAQKLLDYDVLVNNGNWQWVSSSGADSQPYFRIFNPILQSKKFDKNAEYIKKWLPQLKNIPPKDLHDWEKYHSKYDLKKINYFEPIINYKESRDITLDMYKKALK
jgi:deoxyribodipyrimidine photo-lyase